MDRTNSIKAWLLAARPKTLTGAAAPVIMGGVAAWRYCTNVSSTHFEWAAFLLCLVFAMLMHVDANFINDYFDYKKGSDREDRLGPKRACAEGWITPKAMKTGIVITTVLACAAGFPLILYGGWTMLAVGAFCVLFAFLYTTKLSYLGFGDILVVIFFGLVPVGLTWYLQTGVWTLEILLAALACGLATDCLLIINNYRDIEQDRLSGKRTIAVRIGAKWTRILYCITGIVATVLAAMAISLSTSFVRSMTMCVYLARHLHSTLKVSRTEGRALNALLGETSGNILLFSLIFSIMLLF